MNYWLDLFTGTTWQEFLAGGAKVSGFRERRRATAARIQPGDVFLCYLTHVMRWVGALEVLGTSRDTRRIWKDAEFPVRFDVKPLIRLSPEAAVPMREFEGRLSFYSGPKDSPGYKGFLRGSPNLFRKVQDAELILEALRQAEASPVLRPVDQRKLSQRPLFRIEQRRGKRNVPTVVSVPEPEESGKAIEPEPTTRHTEIQFELLKLGAELGLDVWVARNDRGKRFNGEALGSLPRMIEDLPTQFNEATTRTIELIDVLWLKGNTIVAAFEVECTTSIYSGLLRMSDLLALQPNLEINLYLVAPDERREKVQQELLRPTFKIRDKALSAVCGFLGFNKLCQHVAGIRKLGLAASLNPSFLRNLAEFFDTRQSALSAGQGRRS